MTDRAATLLTIIALARRGALEKAWASFREAGLEAVQDDPAVLTLKGRLLKDAALRASGEVRRTQARAAGSAYAEAARLAPGPYPLINAATLAFIAGDVARSRQIADQALQACALDAQDETPYWLAATRAEAFLLGGRRDAAEQALARAIEIAPRAWEDHASTLRQLTIISTELGQDPAWLDSFRPPRSLHFGGTLRLGHIGAEHIGQIDRLLESERVGFAYGALAAGGDLLIAERVLERGAELTLVLPCSVPTFVERSVRPAGEDQVRRFNQILDRAVDVLAPAEPELEESTLFGPAIALSTLIAMGRAVMNGGMLASEAVQLIIVGDPQGHSAAAARIWREAGRRQHQLGINVEEPPPARRDEVTDIVSVLVIAPPEAPDILITNHQLLNDAILGPHGVLEDHFMLSPPRWTSSGLATFWRSPHEAVAAAEAIRARQATRRELRMGLHTGVLGRLMLRGSGSTWVGQAVRTAEAVMEAAPPGAIVASGSFVAAHSALEKTPGAFELIGETSARREGSAVELYSLFD